KELKLYKDRMTEEMSSAYELQGSILPRQGELDHALRYNRLDIASHFESSSEIGGDFWGLKPLADRRQALWIVDFSGHVVTAALNAFRLQAYLKEDSALAGLPGEYLTQLNAKLLHLLMRGHFATMFYGVIDTDTDRLSYGCACTPNPILYRTADRQAV